GPGEQGPGLVPSRAQTSRTPSPSQRERGDRVAVPFSMLASDSGTQAGDQRYAFLIAPQVAPCVERGGVGLEPLPTILLEVGAPGLPITEQRYVSFVAVSVISPLAAAAAV